MSSDRKIAYLTRELIKACGGLEEASSHCGLSTAQLSRCQTPGSGQYLNIRAVAELEHYCGQPVITAVLAQENAAPVSDKSLITEACEAAEAAANMQRVVRLVRANPSPRDRDMIRSAVLDAQRELDDVAAKLDAEEVSA